jgi:hypothetical protein
MNSNKITIELIAAGISPVLDDLIALERRVDTALNPITHFVKNSQDAIALAEIAINEKAHTSVCYLKGFCEIEPRTRIIATHGSTIFRK